VPEQKVVPYYDVPLTDENGRYNKDALIVQDFVAWISQGEIARRDLERLGQSDVGVIMYRQLLQEQIERVEEGQEPTIGIFRDPAANRCVTVPEARLPSTVCRTCPRVSAFNNRGRMSDSIRGATRSSRSCVNQSNSLQMAKRPRLTTHRAFRCACSGTSTCRFFPRPQSPRERLREPRRIYRTDAAWPSNVIRLHESLVESLRAAIIHGT